MALPTDSFLTTKGHKNCFFTWIYPYQLLKDYTNLLRIPRQYTGTPSAPPTLASGFCDVCPLFHPRIVSVRTGRLGKFIYRAPAPRLENCTAPLGASRYRSSTNSTNTIDSPS